MAFPADQLLVSGVAVVATVVQASFVEWTFHRYWLHRPRTPRNSYTSHTLVHHRLCAFDDTFVAVEPEQEESMTFKWWGGPLLVVLNLLPWAAVAWALAALGVATPWLTWIATVAGVITVYYIGYEGLHFLMHKPQGWFVERTPMFRALERHHRIHHKRMDRNLNVLFPLADVVMRTRLAEMPAQAVTPPTARDRARQHSEYGKRMRQRAS